MSPRLVFNFARQHRRRAVASLAEYLSLSAPGERRSEEEEWMKVDVCQGSLGQNNQSGKEGVWGNIRTTFRRNEVTWGSSLLVNSLRYSPSNEENPRRSPVTVR